MGEEQVNSGEPGCTAALRTIPAIVPACLNDPKLRSRVAVTDLKARVPTIHVSPKHKPFSPKPCHLVQKCDDLLGGKLQRMTLKLSLNHHPSRMKEDQWMAPSVPAPQGQAWRAHPLASHQAARQGGTWRRAEGKLGFHVCQAVSGELPASPVT